MWLSRQIPQTPFFVDVFSYQVRNQSGAIYSARGFVRMHFLCVCTKKGTTAPGIDTALVLANCTFMQYVS